MKELLLKEGKEKLAMAKAEEKVNTGRAEQSRLLQPSQPSTSTPRKTKDENSVVVPKSQKSFPLTPQSHLQTSTPSQFNQVKRRKGRWTFHSVSQKGITKAALR